MQETFDIFKSSPIVRTEGIKYAGSKLKLLPAILDIINSVESKNILDGFSGTTRVSQALAQSGYQVTANDISDWSECFSVCYLMGSTNPNEYKDLIEHLNNVPGTPGWFTSNYGGDTNGGSAISPHDGLKKVWQNHNTEKLDGIRAEIDNLNLNPIEKSVALTSLILALDKVDSTLGHQVSYLKEWSSRSYNKVNLKPPRIIRVEGLEHNVVKSDLIESAYKIGSFDLAYLDPPYGSNNEKMPASRVRYQSYYHLWKTIILNDEPELFGKANRRQDSSDSVQINKFEDFRINKKTGKYLALEAIECVVSRIQAKYILLSYSNNGRATSENLRDMLSSYGAIQNTVEVDHKRNVMHSMRWTNDWVKDKENINKELLILLKKN